MKLGDVVRASKNKTIIGEVIAIDDSDIVSIKLLDGGTEFKASINDLILEVGANNPHFEDRKVTILGQEYSISFKEDTDDIKILSCDGYMDFSNKKIVVGVFEYSTDSVKNLEGYTKKVMRHEIIHAFIWESGIWSNSFTAKSWGTNEEMTDWIAIQAPKLHKAFKEAGCDE